MEYGWAEQQIAGKNWEKTKRATRKKKKKKKPKRKRGFSL